MKSFAIHTPEDKLLTNRNVKYNGFRIIGDYIESEKILCHFLKAHFCKWQDVKSFKQWAREMNEDENFEGGFTEESALDHLSNNYVLNVDGKHVNIYEFFQKHYSKD